MSDFRKEIYTGKYLKELREGAINVGMNPSEIEQFFDWKEREFSPDGFPTLAKLIELAADTNVRREYVERNIQEVSQNYGALMAASPMIFKFGQDFQKKYTTEQTDPYFQKVLDRLLWQNAEMHYFILQCFRRIPKYLAQKSLKVASGHYTETLRVDRTQQDLVNEKAIDLTRIPQHHAYAKITRYWNGEPEVFSGLIRTLPVGSDPDRNRRDEDGLTAEEVAQEIGREFSKTRPDIEAEIRARQEKWRGGGNDSPPTHQGGNSPPTPLSGRAGDDSEPPPTHSLPEERPPENSAAAQLRTGTDDRGEVKRRQTGNILDFSSYQQKRREIESTTPLKSSHTHHATRKRLEAEQQPTYARSDYALKRMAVIEVREKRASRGDGPVDATSRAAYKDERAMIYATQVDARNLAVEKLVMSLVKNRHVGEEHMIGDRLDTRLLAQTAYFQEHPELLPALEKFSTSRRSTKLERIRASNASKKEAEENQS